MNLITGINGFLGSALAASLQPEKVVGLIRDKNWKYKSDYLTNCSLVYGDVTDLELLKRVINDYEVTNIYHLAAQSIVKLADSNPLDTFKTNVIGTANVLEAVRQINQKIKVVCASSDKAYGIHEELPYTEDMDLRASDIYSTSKACGDFVAQTYAKSYGLNINIIRSANIYGHGDLNFSRIIPGTIRRILNKKPPIVFTNVLRFKREFIHVDDVCEAYKIVAECGVPGHSYNIGDQDVLTMWEVVDLICDHMKWEGFDLIERDLKEIPFQYLSAEKLKSLGWSKKVSFEDGIRRTIEWYMEHLK